MTAKSETVGVVAYRPVVRKDGNATCGYTAHMTSKPDNRDSDWRGEESRQWVKLADHESALAELRAEASAWFYQATQQSDKLTTLLSVLEALAGEMVGESDAAYIRYVRELQSDACKGKQLKMHHGKFGQDELAAHTEAARLFVEHRTLIRVANRIRALIPAAKEST